MAQIAAQKCEFSCDKVAVLYCKGCGQFLCIECRQNVHDRVRQFKDHEVVDIHKEGNRVRPTPVCETHKNQFLYYCSKCECQTCAECITSSHNEHKTEKIKIVADARRQNVNQIIEQLKTKVETVKKKLETIETEHSIQIQSECESYVKTVDETLDDLHKIVDRHKLIPMTTASDFKNIENEDLGRKRAFFRNRQDDIVDRLLKFENLLLETHDSTFLTEWKALQTDVQMNDEETDHPLVAPRRIDSFDQKKLTRSVIDEIDEKFQMKLKEQEQAVISLTEGIGALKDELKEKQEQIDDMSKLLQGLKEKERMVTGLQEENTKLTTEFKQREKKAFSQLKEKEKRVNELLEEIDKLKSNLKIKQNELEKKSNQVDTKADLTNKLTIHLEDKIIDLENKLKQSEKKNTAHNRTEHRNYSAEETKPEPEVEGNNMCIATIKDVGNELVIMEAKHSDKKLTEVSKKTVYDGKSQGLTRHEGNVESFNDEEHSIKANNLWELQKIQMLKKFDFVQQIKRNIPDIDIIIRDDQITFVGVEAKKVKQEIKHFMSKLNSRTVDKLPSALSNFCKTSEAVQQSIASSLNKNGILCHWYVNEDCDCLYVFALDSPTLSTAISHILKTVSWIEFTNTDESKFIFKSPEITSFLEKWKPILKVNDIECDDFMVYGITEAVEGFRTYCDSKMEAFVEQQMLLYPKSEVKVVRHRLGARKDVVEFFTKHEHSAWKSFLNDNCIEVEVDDDGEVLLVGEEKQVTNAAREFSQKARLTRKKWSCEVNYPKEVVQKLKVDAVPSIEREFKVSLTVENDSTFFQQQQLGQWVDWNSHIHVALVHGKVYEMAADVLVCPTDGSFAPSRLATVMLEKGGIIMKNDFFQKRMKQANAIYVSSYTGNLPCLMVAYLAVPEYRPSVTMQSEVKQCIQELILAVDKAQLQSIVIPVKILDHIPETTFLHWFASAFIAIDNQLNFLKQIYLCTDMTKNTEIFVEALNSALQKYLNFYNFSHMCGGIGKKNVGAVNPIDMKIELVTGMLVDQKVDVIVNSSNRELDLTKGAVSSTILKKGGQSILRECHDNYPNGIEFGNVAVSSAGNMEFRMICHGALPFWTPAAKLSLQLLAKLVFDCLLEAEKQNCRSIAFPVFGTGNLGYPWDEVARTMLDTINKYGTLRSGITTVKEVKIVLYEKDVKSIKAFESRKRQIEEMKLITEDPEIPPPLILEARCQNVRVQVIPLSDTKCHQCEAVVRFLSFAEMNSLIQKNQRSKLLTDGILTEKCDGENFWTVTVYSDEQEKNYKEATSRALKFATKERIGTLAVCMMHGSGKTLRFKDQAFIIIDVVKDLGMNIYLQVVKIIVPDREKFDLMLSSTRTKQVEESKKWLQKVGEFVFNLKKHQWKCVTYLNVIESPRILVTALVEDKKSLEKLKDKLENEVVKIVRQGKQFLGVTIKQEVEKMKQTEKKNWVQCFNTNRGMKKISLSEDICSQIENAIKFDYPNVEIKDGNDVFVYKMDDFTFYVIGKEDVRGFFMKDLKDDPDDPPEKERKTESNKVENNEKVVDMDASWKSLAASSGPKIEMTFKTSEGIIVKVYKGNILSLDVDCIVNVANKHLTHGRGVAYVIAAAAGYDFKKESDDYIQRNGPIKEGSCCTTSAGNLKYKCVIHTVGPKWYTYNDKTECCRVLRKSVECCFVEAALNGMSSLAKQSISAGILGFPKEVCCKEYGKAVQDFSRQNGHTTSLKEIHFVDKDAGMINMIQKEFSQIFSTKCLWPMTNVECRKIEHEDQNITKGM